MSTAHKRELIDADTNDRVQTAKKPSYTIQPDIKDKVLRFISLSFYVLLSTKKLLHEMNNISVGTQVMNILHTGHSKCRKEGQGTSSNIKATISVPKIVHKGATTDVSFVTVMQVLKRCAQICELTYEKTHDTLTTGDKWLGIAETYFNILTGFSLRWRELRLGYSEFAFLKKPNKSQSFPVSRYGLNGSHYCLLEGIRYPPKRRLSMIQWLGPMTTLLCYLESPPAFADKFKAATVNSLSHIPNIDGILEKIKPLPRAKTRDIVRLLANITLISGSEQQHKCFPFPNLFARACINKDDMKLAIVEAKPEEFILQANNISSNQLRKHISFSDFPSAILYNVGLQTDWTINGTFTDSQARQLVFHCVWGTDKEDFGILRSITNNNTWDKRYSMGRCFQKANTQDSSVSFQLIKLTRFSKLSTAIQTELLAQEAKQVESVLVFGDQSKFYNNFFKYRKENSPAGGGALTLQGIDADLTKIFISLRDQILGNGGVQKAGTCKWMNVEENSSIGKLEGSEEVTTIEICWNM